MAVGLLLNSEGEARRVQLPASSKQIAKTYVIAIGINQYRDAAFSPLKFAAEDARRFVDAVRPVGRFARREVTLLLNHEATLKAVEVALGQVARRVRSGDQVVVYLSGHGSLALGESGELERYSVLHDSREKQLAYTGLSHAFLHRWLDGPR